MASHVIEHDKPLHHVTPGIQNVITSPPPLGSNNATRFISNYNNSLSPSLSLPPHEDLSHTCGIRFRCRSNKSDNRGLISADRNNKATLLLTIPRCTSKSYAKDLSSRILTLLSAGKHTQPFRYAHRCRPARVLRPESLILILLKCARAGNRRVLAWILT